LSGIANQRQQILTVLIEHPASEAHEGDLVLNLLDTADRVAAGLTNIPRRLSVLNPVSYTHLTLPTICSVEISGVAVQVKKKQKTKY